MIAPSHAPHADKASPVSPLPASRQTHAISVDTACRQSAGIGRGRLAYGHYGARPSGRSRRTSLSKLDFTFAYGRLSVL